MNGLLTGYSDTNATGEKTRRKSNEEREKSKQTKSRPRDSRSTLMGYHLV